MLSRHINRAQADLKLLKAKIKLITEILEILEVKESVLFIRSLPLPLAPSLPKDIHASVYRYLRENTITGAMSWASLGIICWPGDQCIQYVLLNRTDLVNACVLKVKHWLEYKPKQQNSLFKESEEDRLKEMQLIPYRQKNHLISMKTEEKKIFLEGIFREKNQYYEPLLCSLVSSAHLLERAIKAHTNGNEEVKSLLLIAIYQEMKSVLLFHENKPEICGTVAQLDNTYNLIINDLYALYNTQPIHYISAGAATGCMLAAKYLFFPRNAISMKITGIGLFVVGGATIVSLTLNFLLRQERKINVLGTITSSAINSVPTILATGLNTIANDVRVELQILGDKGVDKLNKTVDDNLKEIRNKINVDVNVKMFCNIM